MLDRFFSAIVRAFASVFHEEPVVLLGAGGTAFNLVSQQVQEHHVHDWKGVLYLLSAFVVRQWVTSPATAARLKEAAASVAQSVTYHVAPAGAPAQTITYTPVPTPEPTPVAPTVPASGGYGASGFGGNAEAPMAQPPA